MRLRRWKGRTKVLQTTSRYSAVAIALHWEIALLIVANIAPGLRHALFGRRHQVAIMAAHTALGHHILAPGLLRLAGRRSHPPPAPPRANTRLQLLAARAPPLYVYVATIAVAV